jgi:DNA-binding GntR family transcriptional regulator
MSRTTDSVGAAHAYAQVRAAIVENRYPPGHRLIEQRIAEELGLSRTPVREALRMLEAEGLVVSERNRGAMVRPLSQTEVVDLYGLRIRLESYAVEVATERITEQELGALVDAADEFGGVRLSVDGDSVEGVRMLHDANRRFHDGILSAARHHRLATMMARTVDIPLVFQAFRTFGPAEIERSDTFHHLIVEAMCRRDARRGAALMAEHIAQGRDAVLDALAYTDLSEINHITDLEGPV